MLTALAIAVTEVAEKSAQQKQSGPIPLTPIVPIGGDAEAYRRRAENHRRAAAAADDNHRRGRCVFVLDFYVYVASPSGIRYNLGECRNKMSNLVIS